MTLAEALALADQDSPLPHLAGQALKVLRAHVSPLPADRLTQVALHKIKYLLDAGYEVVGVTVARDYDCISATVSAHGRVQWQNNRAPKDLEGLPPLTPEDC
jgi:hypothetical protein